MELLGLSLPALAVAFVIVTFGATLQSTTGFGMGLVAAPVLILLDPTLVPGVVLGVAVPLALVIVVREWRHIEASLVTWAIVGRLPGAVAGGWIVVTLGARELSIIFAATLLLSVVLSLAGLSVKRTNRNLFGAGFFSGMMGTATSVGGPFLALVFQDASGPKLRTTMSAFMAFGGVSSLALLALFGEFGGRELALSAVLAPAAVAGFLASRWTVAFLDRGYTRPAVLTFATIAAVTIVIRVI